MPTLIALCGCALWFVSMALTAYGTWLARAHFKPRPSLGRRPGVSILKPFKGLEPRFSESIESFFKLKYDGDFEILFCASDENDLALPVVRELAANYPHVRSKILIGNDFDVPNPKAGNTHKGYEQATYDTLLISDSNVVVARDGLERMVPLLKDDVGLVTGVVAGIGANTFAGFMEAATLNTFSARWMLTATKAGAPIVMGKAMLFRRSDAERFGGLRTLGLYLAEDYMAGHAMTYLGKKVVVMNDPVTQVISEYQFKTYWLRHVRWGRLRRAQSPFAFFAEPLIACVPIGVIGSLSLSGLMQVSFLALFTAHLGVWFMGDFLLIRSLRTQCGPRFFIGWLAKEALYIPLWIYTLGGRSVLWRGRRLKVEAGGLLFAEGETVLSTR